MDNVSLCRYFLAATETRFQRRARMQASPHRVRKRRQQQFSLLRQADLPRCLNKHPEDAGLVNDENATTR